MNHKRQISSAGKMQFLNVMVGGTYRTSNLESQ